MHRRGYGRGVIVGMSDGWSHRRGYGRGPIVGMSVRWSRGHHEDRVLRVFKKSSHDAFTPVTCVMMPHLRSAFASPGLPGRQRQVANVASSHR